MIDDPPDGVRIVPNLVHDLCALSLPTKIAIEPNAKIFKGIDSLNDFPVDAVSARWIICGISEPSTGDPHNDSFLRVYLLAVRPCPVCYPI